MTEEHVEFRPLGYRNHSIVRLEVGFVKNSWFCLQICGPIWRGSAAARLLRSWVRIPPGAWMSVVSVVCCQVEVSAAS